MSEHPLIRVEGLEVHFPIRGKGIFGGATGLVKAVDGVSFEIRKGETVGLVGESGSGKTTIGRAVLRAVEPTAGRITFQLNGDEVDLADLRRGELRKFRRHMQLIFQDPYSSLNPRMTVRDIIAEPLEAMGLLKTRAEIDVRVREVAARCKLNVEHLRRFPHAFSGGQRQRICIARALVCHPEFMVCDEAVSALDVSIQADVLNLLADLAARAGSGLSLHRPRPVRGCPYLSPGCGHVCRTARRAVVLAADVRESPASLHPGAPVGDSPCRRRSGLQTREARGRNPEPGRSSLWLPLPHALPIRQRSVQARGAEMEGDGGGALRRLPLRGGARRWW